MLPPMTPPQACSSPSPVCSAAPNPSKARMSSDRSWMYKRLHKGGVNDKISTHFMLEMYKFIEFAQTHSTDKSDGKLKCPCCVCKNCRFLVIEDIRSHLIINGFVPNYYIWSYHGERGASYTAPGGSSNPIINSVPDAAGHSFDVASSKEESPNPEAQKFYDMLKAGKQPLYPGCKKHTQLSFASRLMSLKLENSLSKKCYDQLTELIKELVPNDNLVPDNLYSSKKLLKGMGLSVEKIDCCKNNCMIYWRDDSELTDCKFCDEPRFKPISQRNRKRRKTRVAYKKMYYFPLTPRLQRLYSSDVTAKDMRWHAEHVVEDGVMRHPSDSVAWKYFSQTHPEFAAETRNVRLGLNIDKFQSFGFSSWPIFVTPYNLPPSMCMKEQHMFLSILVPGPKNPNDKLDVFLQPLIAELNELWTIGTPSYDISKKQNFQLRAALMWTISDFSAYSMLSGWNTTGPLACPYCMERSDAFILKCSGKQSWFDSHRKFLDCGHCYRQDKQHFRKNLSVETLPPNVRSGIEILAEIERLGLLNVTHLDAAHVNARIAKTSGWRKKSIFWDLPYWKTNLIRHNLDVMQIEKNMFDNVVSTVLNVKGKTKDTPKSREELNDYCNRPELAPDASGNFPKACYTLDNPSKAALIEWVRDLKFPDGYTSNMSHFVDKKGLSLVGMKSRESHVFMQRLLPIAFRELLPSHVWKALTELSLFFKDLTSTIIGTKDMSRLHRDIPLILCQLEQIFPPSFFDSMVHLPVHLAYEAKIAGPVQYRWMQPFKKYLCKLKKNVKKNSRIEGLVANAYLVEETSNFSSYYFKDHVPTKRTTSRRNDGSDSQYGKDDDGAVLSVFKRVGQTFAMKEKKFLNTPDFNLARLYILLNCAEVDKYVRIYTKSIELLEPNITHDMLSDKLDNEFVDWFKLYVRDPSNNVTDENIKSLAEGPSQCVRTYTCCKVNGYMFHAVDHECDKKTASSGVCVKESNYEGEKYDYYGRLIEVVELEYTGHEERSVLLFKCDWFDQTSTGTKVHPHYKLVDINHKRRFIRYEPFALASQTVQVYYCVYPSLKHNMLNWWAACKIKTRSSVEFMETVPDEPFQEEVVDTRNSVQLSDVDFQLNDPTGNDWDGLVDDDDDTEDEFTDQDTSDEELDDNFDNESVGSHG